MNPEGWIGIGALAAAVIGNGINFLAILRQGARERVIDNRQDVTDLRTELRDSRAERDAVRGERDDLREQNRLLEIDLAKERRDRLALQTTLTEMVLERRAAMESD